MLPLRIVFEMPLRAAAGVTTSSNACRRHRDRVVRRGLGLLIESDFYATEAGRKHFTDQL